MEDSIYISRQLISRSDEKKYTENYLVDKFSVVVILAEPGAGKTELLKSLSRKLDTRYIKASRFKNETKINKCSAVVIDAIDEVAKIDQLAVDDILAKASNTEAEKIVLASRASEWSDARTKCLSEYFNGEIKVLYLEPFCREEQQALFLAQFPNEEFYAFFSKIERLKLDPLLSNPLFLILFSKAYIQSDRKFESKENIFSDAIKYLATEHNPSPQEVNRPHSEKVIAVASEYFAKLLLSGSVGLAKSENSSDKEFPYFGALSSNANNEIAVIFDTQLFKPFGEEDLFEPAHRIPAEYAAANYFRKKIEDPADLFSINRFLSIVAPKGIVRDELRGLIGWLASLGNSAIQKAVIELDPYAVLANGDPSQLLDSSKEYLIHRLAEASEVDPYFRRGDAWRSFGLSDFFDSCLVGVLKKYLRSKNQNSQFRNLLLDLLSDSKAAQGLTPELRNFMLSEKSTPLTRKQSLRCLIRVPNYHPIHDFRSLVVCGTKCSLELAAEIVEQRGVGTIGQSEVLRLLKAFTKLYPKNYNASEHVIGSRYFIRTLVQTFSLNEIKWFLDQLSDGLCCTCEPKAEWKCACLDGISRVIGYLLDQYFAGKTSNIHDPRTIWQWMKALNFSRESYHSKSPSITALQGDDALRQAIHWLAYSKATTSEEISKLRIFWPVGHGHAGLQMQLKDRLALINKAFDEQNFFLWDEFYSSHYLYSVEHTVDPIRNLMRAQANTSPEFMKIWKLREHAFQERRKRDRTEHRSLRPRRNRWEQRQRKIQKSNLLYLKDNREQISSGRHWGWLRMFADFYLSEPEKISDHVDDPKIQEIALCNCLPFLKPDVPSLEEIAEAKRQSKSFHISKIIFAACLAIFRRDGSLLNVERPFLEVVLTYGVHIPVDDNEKQRFEAELNARLLNSNEELGDIAKRYIEPQLAPGGQDHTSTDWLRYKEAFYPLRTTHPIIWLENYPDMPFPSMDTLFNIVVTEGNNMTRLKLLIEKSCDRYMGCQESDEFKKRKLFWSIRHFFFIDEENTVWGHLFSDKSTVLAFASRIGRFSDTAPGWPTLSARKVFLFFNAFVDDWPKVFLPDHHGTDDPEGETAYRFLKELIWTIGKDSPNKSLPVIDEMLAHSRFINFHDPLKNMKVEALREQVLRDYRAPSATAINQLLEKSHPATVEDLRSFVIEQLEQMQLWLKGNPTNPIDTFYSGGKRVDENTARNRIVDRLESQIYMIDSSVNIEAHMNDSKRCDITISKTIEGLHRLLVIEVKGQWNSKLYTAAKAQLSDRYSIHPKASGQGIYLVLWFNDAEKIAGKNDSAIDSMPKIKEKIYKEMPDNLTPLIDVFVLDVSKI